MVCGHESKEDITIGSGFDSDSNPLDIIAVWCPECGSIQDSYGTWQQSFITVKLEAGGYWNDLEPIWQSFMDDREREVKDKSIEKLIEEKKEDYEIHARELAKVIPSEKATVDDIAAELVKYVERFLVPIREAKRSVARKFGVNYVVSMIVEDETTITHCPDCGFAVEDCQCDKFGDLDDVIEEIQGRINSKVGDPVLKRELIRLLNQDIPKKMAKESVIAQYTIDESNQEDLGSRPCLCGKKYVKQGKIWWCPGCKENFVVE